MPTTVIDVHRCDRISLEADPGFRYVGRAVPWQGWKASPWRNPYRVPKTKGGTLVIRSPGILSVEDAVRAFAELVRSTGREHAIRRELRGMVLGCWCGNWKPGEPEIACHAVVLARIADGAAPNPADLLAPPDERDADHCH